MKTIKLTRNKVTIVDDDDYEFLSQWNWQCNNRGYATGNQYVRGKRRTVLMSRIIMKCPDNQDVDHINRDTLDNRKENLRICKTAENCRNRKKNKVGTSQFKGVSWKTERKAWVAQICVNWKKIHIGYFKTEIDAAHAYNEAAIKYYGEFARLNKI